jgi:hypothetical protein
MPRKLTLLCLIGCSFLVFSCHKSNDAGGSSAQLVGNYKLLYLSLQSQSVNQVSGGGQTQKTVTNTSYTTVQNTGTISFTKDSIASKGVGYTANWTSIGYVYQNGSLIDSVSIPFSITIPPTNSATKYDVIGSDSLYFHGGYLTAGIGGGSTIAPPSGGRYSFKGDTLFLISKVSQTTPPQTSGGITVTASASGVATIAMLKQ